MSDATESTVPEATNDRTESDEDTSRDEDLPFSDHLRRREVGVLFAFIVLFGLIAVTRPNIFFDWNQMSNVTARLLRQVAPYVVIGIGMTFLIISGEFDLSVGSMYAVGGISFAILLTEHQLVVPVAVLVVVLIGAAVGLTNGVIVTKGGVPSLITTIGMLSVLRGIAFYLTPAGSRQTPDLGLLDLLGGEAIIGGLAISYQVFWAIGLTILFGAVLQKTRFGYQVYATGDDEQAASMTGVNTDRVKILNFVITGGLTAFAGVLAISYFGSMFGTAGTGFELLVIAAVVIGGTNLFGGEGSLSGMFLGSLVIGVIPVLLVLNGLSVEIQEFLTGVVIIGAVLADILIRR